MATSTSYLQELITISSLRASWVSLIIRKVHSEIGRSLSTNFTKTYSTCSYNLTKGCPLTTAVRSWRQKSRKKIRTNQTRFGMVSEKLSTHPSGKKTSAAHFESIPTRRLAVQFKLFTNNFGLLFSFRKPFYRTSSRMLGRLSPLKNI